MTQYQPITSQRDITVGYHQESGDKIKKANDISKPLILEMNNTKMKHLVLKAALV